MARYGCASGFLRKPRRCLPRLILLSCALAAILALTRYIWLVANRRICFKGPVLKDIEKLCQSYKSGLISGNLCQAACDDHRNNSFEVVSCLGNHYGKSTVFSAKINGQNVIVKFADTNIFTSYVASKKWLKMWSGKVEDGLRGQKLQDLWGQNWNREQFISDTLRDDHIFPEAVSSCGNAFAVREAQHIPYPSYLNRLEDVLTTQNVRQKWKYRLRLALKMVDLICRVDQAQGAPYSICDLKYQHFGIIDDQVVMLDADHFYPKAVADALINSEVACKIDDDCDHLDCPGKCDQDSRTCRSLTGVDAGINLRNLCLKIFEGTYKLEFFKYQPGLLDSSLSSQQLKKAISKCSRGHGTPDVKSIRSILQEEINRVQI